MQKDLILIMLDLSEEIILRCSFFSKRFKILEKDFARELTRMNANKKRNLAAIVGATACPCP